MPLPLPSSTSPTLIGRLRDEATRDAAWQEFVGRYGRLLYRWCRQWGLQPSDAEDTAQEILMIIFQEIQCFEAKPNKTFRTWLRVIALNAWHHYRRGRFRQPDHDAESLTGEEACNDLIERFDAMARQELIERAMILVRRQIDPLAWRAFVLTSLEHRPGVAVAQELDQTPSWVYQVRSRIRKQIRQTIRDLDFQR